MLECMVNFTLVEHAYGALFRPPLSQPGYVRLLSAWRRPYATLDGYICVVPYSTQHWQRFFDAAGQPQVMHDERFRTLAERTRHIDVLYGELARCLAQRTTAQWMEVCERLDIPAAPMRRLDELEDDPHLAATGFFLEMHDPGLGRFVLPRPPLLFDGAAATPGLPPRLGEHTVDVLREAGLSGQAIEQLLGQGAAVQHNQGSHA